MNAQMRRQREADLGAQMRCCIPPKLRTTSNDWQTLQAAEMHGRHPPSLQEESPLPTPGLQISSLQNRDRTCPLSCALCSVAPVRQAAMGRSLKALTCHGCRRSVKPSLTWLVELAMSPWVVPHCSDRISLEPSHLNEQGSQT